MTVWISTERCVANWREDQRWSASVLAWDTTAKQGGCAGSSEETTYTVESRQCRVAGFVVQRGEIIVFGVEGHAEAVFDDQGDVYTGK